MKSCVLLLTCTLALAAAIPPPHPDVLAVELEEDFLPYHLKGKALHNPHLKQLLHLSSLLHKGEKIVFNREAHGVSRKEIYNILTHAGFIGRKDPYYQSYLNEPAILKSDQSHPDIDIFSLPIFKSPDFLQHL